MQPGDVYQTYADVTDRNLKLPKTPKNDFWKCVFAFAKKNIVMIIAFLAALITSIIVVPDAEYLSYFDLKTLTCLFCVRGMHDKTARLDIASMGVYPVVFYICVCMAVAEGASRLTENVYETRFFGYCTELQEMGANILVNGKTAVVTGTGKLRGTEVTAHDLRAGAALIIAGLAANGTTRLRNIHFVERGYENVIEKFTALGADIVRVEE